MSRRRWLHACVSCFVLLVVLAAPRGGLLEATADPIDHVLYTELLQAYVDEEGLVDYRGLKERGMEKLNAYVEELAGARTSDMGRGERMALYINAYNAFTLKLIADPYPVESIRDIPGLSGLLGLGQWQKEMWTLAGQEISLDHLEHGMLRPMGDPRIHFALVCAAVSCPPLAREAYTAGRLDEQLERQGRIFNRSPKGLRTWMKEALFGTSPVLKLSTIYKWFREDFLEKAEDLPSFVLPYAGPQDQTFIREHREDLEIDYLDYDWSLNDQPRNKRSR